MKLWSLVEIQRLENKVLICFSFLIGDLLDFLKSLRQFQNDFFPFLPVIVCSATYVKIPEPLNCCTQAIQQSTRLTNVTKKID